MDEKMTSGEIAKKAGVSQKAVRLYDEKGLLKPTDYSEGNYRLYDKEALQILEKIVALKQIGFSLEEIRDNLVAGDAEDIEAALRMQLKVMEEKRYRIEMVIDAINRTLARREKLDWDDVADIVKNVSIDQEADRRHWQAINHAVPGEDWYVKVFNSLNIKADEKILDLGCGYSKLWRSNWERIPEGTKISAYDIHGSWADDFAEYLEQNRVGLPKGVNIDLEFSDLEEDATWDKIGSKKKYSMIIAHYLKDELKDYEALIARIPEIMTDDGFFSINGPALCSWDIFFKDALAEEGIETPFIDCAITEQQRESDAFKALLEKYFNKIRTVKLKSSFRYCDADELLSKMKDDYSGQEKFFAKYQDRIRDCFEKMIASNNGELIIDTEGAFYHCGK
jgi:DNA-binding transcriptional MerR regulator